VDLGYIWICSVCYQKLSVNVSTPFAGINLKSFDLSLRLTLAGSSQNVNQRLNCRTTQQYHKVIRRAQSLYIQERVLPYLQLPGPVEIDETCISRRVRNNIGCFPKLRWVFGMFCRTTKMAVMYYIPFKKSYPLMNLVKKHVPPGSTVFSDAAASYVNLHRPASHLNRYGWYHFWINHSDNYVHEKLPFVCTSKIESTWGQMKQKYCSLNATSDPVTIGEYLDNFLAHTIMKKEKLYDFTLQCLSRYYWSRLQQFRELSQ